MRYVSLFSGIEPDTARRTVCERWAREKALNQMADEMKKL